MARAATAKIAPRRAAGATAVAATGEAGKSARGERNCSVARTLDIVSDAWAFLIIREAFFGTRTFEAFRSALGIPRATLTDRLRKLTQLAIFRQVATACRQRKEYRLTKMGFDLYPSFIALMQFGDRWLSGSKPPAADAGSHDLRLRQPPYRGVFRMFGRTQRKAVKYRDGPGAGRSRQSPGATPGAPPMEAGSCSAGQVRCRARCRSLATNGASWSCARLSSAIAATTKSSPNSPSRRTS